MTDLRLNHPVRADDPEVPDVPVPPGPEPQEPGENKALTSPINELESRLLRRRFFAVLRAIPDAPWRVVPPAPTDPPQPRRAPRRQRWRVTLSDRRTTLPVQASKWTLLTILPKDWQPRDRQLVPPTA